MEHTELEQEKEITQEDLIAAANRTSSWRERLNAVQELGKWDNPRTITVLTHKLNGDLVYRVQEAAYQTLRELGQDVQRPAKKKGELFKGVGKILLRIKKSLPSDHSFEEFKEKLKRTRLDVYDAYEGDKGDDFDKWLEDTWSSLAGKKA
ncbi:HEAT repeat domain-containing protein [Paenibacillus daejeonensis]|uniref:HEAT repeat domain-containing protein n=1 Tax=Paenibacillus daejeonensis TaxID=135193 RepID=UPI00037E12EF|nr:HEAT repeat domain-containing protein [Paenibacillus daejeonensis]